MRLRAGLVVCLFFVLVGVGCRDALVPNIDSNLPPETWITAAPQDTITTKNPSGMVIPPSVGTIPVIFHLYWAGSDQDGEVIGYYYAVVETTTSIPVGSIRPPRLPGPKPRDYHFTTRTDTTFIFNVAEFSPDREHAFYIYAVDNKGRPDPTPARFIFNSLDRYPPVPIIEEASALGTIFARNGSGNVFSKDTTYFVTDTLNPMTVTKDFVPVGSQLTFRWHAELRSPLLPGVAFKYKLDETDFVTVDSSVKQIVYPKGKVGPGQKIFTLKALDQAGGAISTTRRFGLNLSPDTWWSGPDPNSPVWASRPKHPFTTAQLKYFAVSSWANVPPLTGSLMSCDSLQIMPSARPFRRSFLEIWKDTIYVRTEGDTVHMNSFVVLGNGGFDPDSPYNVRVAPLDPTLVDSVRCAGSAIVVHEGPPNGSPIGFRAFLGTDLDPTHVFSQPSITGLYPVFDPTSFRWKPTINSYQSAIQSGKAYATSRAEDGTGQDLGGLDRSVPPNLKGWTDNIDNNGSGVSQLDLINRNKKVMTFYVNYSPFLLTSAPTFSPRLKISGPDSLPVRQVNINLLADDIDPLDPSVISKVGGPTPNKVFRFTVSFKGKNAAGRDTTISPLDLFQLSTISVPSYPIPSDIRNQDVDLIVELCDCRECETSAGKGRCVYQTFPLFLPPATAPRAAATEASMHSGPGSSSASSRSSAP
jgi:hypothetical protein